MNRAYRTKRLIHGLRWFSNIEPHLLTPGKPTHERVYIKCVVILIENLQLDITFGVRKKKRGEIH